MYAAKLILVIGFVVLFGLVVVDNRFGVRDPQYMGVTVDATAPWWKKVLVRWNDHVRFGGLLLVSMGLSAFGVQVRHQPANTNLAFIGMAGVGVLLYAWGLSWRWFLAVRDSEGS